MSNDWSLLVSWLLIVGCIMVYPWIWYLLFQLSEDGSCLVELFKSLLKAQCFLSEQVTTSVKSVTKACCWQPECSPKTNLMPNRKQFCLLLSVQSGLVEHLSCWQLAFITLQTLMLIVPYKEETICLW